MAHLSTSDIFRASTPPLNSTPSTQTKLRVFDVVKHAETQIKIYKDVCKASKKSSQYGKAKWERVKINFKLRMQCTKTTPGIHKSISDTPQTEILIKSAPPRRKSMLISNSDVTRQTEKNIIRKQDPVSARKMPARRKSMFITNSEVTSQAEKNIIRRQDPVSAHKIVSDPCTFTLSPPDLNHSALNTRSDSSSHVQSLPNRRKSVCHTGAGPSMDNSKSPDHHYSVYHTGAEPSMANNKSHDEQDSAVIKLSMANGESAERCSSRNSTIAGSSIQILGSSNINTNQTPERGSSKADLKFDLIKVSQSPAAKRDLESSLGEEKFKSEIKPEQGVYSIQKSLLLSEYVIEILADRPGKIDVDADLSFFYSDASLNTFCLDNTFVNGLIDSTSMWVKSEADRKSLSVSISKLDIFNVLKKVYISHNPEYVVTPPDLVEKNSNVSPKKFANIGASTASRKSPDTNANTSSTRDLSNSSIAISMQRANYQVEAPNLAPFVSPYHHYCTPTVGGNNSYYDSTNSMATDRLSAVPLSPFNIPAHNNTATVTLTTSKSTTPLSLSSAQQKQLSVNPKPNPVLNPYYGNLYSGTGLLNPHYNNIQAGTDSSLINGLVTQPILLAPIVANTSHIMTQPKVTHNHTTPSSQPVYNNNQPVYYRGDSGMDLSLSEANIMLPTKHNAENILNSQISAMGKQTFALPLPQVEASQSASSTTSHNISNDTSQRKNIVSQTDSTLTNIQTTASARQSLPPNTQKLSNPRTAPAFGEQAIASPTTPSLHRSSQPLPVATRPNLPVHSARLHSYSNSKHNSAQHDKTLTSPEDGNTSAAGQALMQSSNANAPSHARDDLIFSISVIDKAKTLPASRIRSGSSHSMRPTILAAQPRFSPYESRMNPSPRAATTASPTTPCTNQKRINHSTKSLQNETQQNAVTSFNYSALTANNQARKYNQPPSTNYHLPSPNNPNNNYGNYEHYFASRSDVSPTWHGNCGEYASQLEQSRTSSRLGQPGPPVNMSSTSSLRGSHKPARITSRRQTIRAHQRWEWESNLPYHPGHSDGYQYPVQPEAYYPYMGSRGWGATGQMLPPREMPVQPPPYPHHRNNSYYPHGNAVNPSNKSAPHLPPYRPGAQEPTPREWRIPMNQEEAPHILKKRKEYTENSEKRESVREARRTRSSSDLQRKLRPQLNNRAFIPLLKEDIWSTIHGYDYKKKQGHCKSK